MTEEFEEIRIANEKDLERELRERGYNNIFKLEESGQTQVGLMNIFHLKPEEFVKAVTSRESYKFIFKRVVRKENAVEYYQPYKRFVLYTKVSLSET